MPFRHSSHTWLQFAKCSRVWLECNFFASYNEINIVLSLIIDIDGFARLQLVLGYHNIMSITLKYALPYPLHNTQWGRNIRGGSFGIIKQYAMGCLQNVEPYCRNLQNWPRAISTYPAGPICYTQLI